MANRHLSRSIVLQSLYEWDFNNFRSTKSMDGLYEVKNIEESPKLKKIVSHNIDKFGPGIEDASFVWGIIQGIVGRLKKIDTILEKALPNGPLNKLLIDRNVLRIGIYELLFVDREEVPQSCHKWSIELAKHLARIVWKIHKRSARHDLSRNWGTDERRFHEKAQERREKESVEKEKRIKRKIKVVIKRKRRKREDKNGATEENKNINI